MSGRNPVGRGRKARAPGRRRRRRPGGNRKKNVNAEQSHVLAVFNHTRIPRSLASNTPVPPQMIRHFRFIDPVIIYRNALASFYVREFRVNSLFDPDPLLGGGSVSGYTELAQLYNRNIVTHVKMKADLVNIEPTAVVGAYIIFRDVQPSTVILTFNDAISSAEVAPATTIKMLGTVAGMPKARLSARIPLASILGRPLEYLTDVGYAANVNFDPPQVLWGALVLFSYTPLTLLTNGVAAALTLDFTSNWFSGQKALDLTSPHLSARQRHIDSLMSDVDSPPVPVITPTPQYNNNIIIHKGPTGPFPSYGGNKK